MLRATLSVSLGWSPEFTAGVSQVCSTLGVRFFLVLGHSFYMLQITCAPDLTPAQIAQADIADDIIQSFPKSGVKVIAGCAMAIVFIAVCNSACERFHIPCLLAL